MDNIINYKYNRFRQHYAGDDYMCEILRKIRNKSAYALLEEYNIKQEPPIDIWSLLDGIGIIAIPMDFTDLEQEFNEPNGSILGAAISKGKSLTIFYQRDATSHRQKFTIAHELAHCCLHCPTDESSHVEYRTESYKSYNLTDTYKRREKEANIFAGQLLIPKDTLMRMYKKMLMPSLSTLSQIFDVSAAVMAARLDYLHLGYYKDVQTSVQE